jgi:tRNA(adenine34) deaminase
VSGTADYERYMREAIALAAQGAGLDDVPVGAVIVRDGEIIAAEHNRRIIDADPTAHAEMLAIRSAARNIKDWRLGGCTLFVTLEPCCMCAGAIVLARLDRVVYGAADPKAGAIDTLYRIGRDERLNHTVEVVPGVLADECGRLLSDFFRRRRDLGKK